ncbi:MAG: hypothetical protein RLZZ15_2216 [Verrucomicrobiota bacterium]|jgi:voltage-gated potassium channel
MLQRLRFVFALIAASFVGGTLVFWLAEFPADLSARTLGDSMWWWFVSSTTVGYGDIYPHTVSGRLAGVVAILVGVFAYTTFITVVADSLHGISNQKNLGTAPVKARGHLVICEYTAFADELIQALPRHPALARLETVILTDLVSTRPYAQHHFVRGVPLSPVALQQAAVADAAIVFIFANARFADPDLKTIHIAHRVRVVAPQARLFIELNHADHELARDLGANVTVLASKDLLASVLRTRTLDLNAHFPT